MSRPSAAPATIWPSSCGYTTFRYFPLHRVPAYGLAGSFPNADYAADHTLCLPIHQALTDDEVNYICDKIIEFGKNNNL